MSRIRDSASPVILYYSHNETVQKLSKYQKSGDSDISSVSYDNTISLKLSSHSRSSKLLDDRVSVPSDKRCR